MSFLLYEGQFREQGQGEVESPTSKQIPSFERKSSDQGPGELASSLPTVTAFTTEADWGYGPDRAHSLGLESGRGASSR